MGFQKGNPGKRPGTKNRNKKLVEETAKRLGVDPFEILCLFAKGDWKSLGYKSETFIHSINDHGTFKKYTIDPSIRAKCAQEACQYLNAKLRSVELKNADGTGFKIHVVDYTVPGGEKK